MTSNTHEPQSLQERLEAQIARHELSMRPRSFFVVRVIGLVVLAIAVLLISLYLFSLLFFILRLNGHGSLLRLGSRGLFIFIRVFPWWLLVIDVFFVFLLQFVLRYFKFGYRSPALYLLGALVVVALIGGALVDSVTGVNDSLLRSADQGRLPPPLNGVYQHARRQPPSGSGAFRGTVTAVASSSFTLSDDDLNDAGVQVILLGNGPDANAAFSVGDTVFVVGDKDGEIIRAVFVRPISPDGIPPHPKDRP